jgi:hypothetical protein
VPLFDNLIASLEFGIRHAIADINILTLQAVAPLGIWATQQKYNQGKRTLFALRTMVLTNIGGGAVF